MLKLIAPGKRKSNPFWIARGRINGKLHEFSTGQIDKAAAERVAAEALGTILNRPIQAQAVHTMKQAASAYTDWKSPPAVDVRRINKIMAVIGQRDVSSITQADVVAAATQLYPKHKPSSKNRLVVTPISAIIHYAAQNKWCARISFSRFTEAAPETRAVEIGDAQKLIDLAEGFPKALLVFLFRQGMRVSDAIEVTWEQVNLKHGTLDVRIAKTDKWKVKALHPDARAALKAVRPDGATGKVFPYKNRWGVYRALESVVAATGVKFTPHMARHSVGKWLNASGAGIKTIMDILDHSDPKSSIRYQSTDLPGQRRALQSMGKHVGGSKSPKEIK